MTDSGSASGCGDYTEVAPAALAAWLDRFADRHEGFATLRATDTIVVLHAVDGAIARLEVPNPPLDLPATGAATRIQIVVLLAGLVAHVLRAPECGPVRIHLRIP